VEGGLSFDITAVGDGFLIAVAGEVDMATAPQLAQCLVDHAGQDVVLDLSKVGLLDSSGLSVLVRAYREAREAGHTLSTWNEPDNVRVVLEVTGLFDRFHLDGDATPD
jgi:anti-anti-sigma factor